MPAIQPAFGSDEALRFVLQMSTGMETLEGNIQIAHMYEHTPEQIRVEAEALIADVRHSRSSPQVLG